MRRFAAPLLALAAGFILAKSFSGTQSNPMAAMNSTPALALRSTANPPSAGVASGEPATRAVAALDALTTTDFAAIAADPPKLLTLVERDAPPELAGAYLDALVERWLTLDPAGGFRAIRLAVDELAKRKATVRETILTDSLKEVLIERCPRETLAWLSGKLTAAQKQFEYNPALIALARQNPREARAMFDAITDKNQREGAAYSLALGLAANDPVAAAARARDLGDTSGMSAALAATASHGRETLRQVLDILRGQDLEGEFAEVMLRYPDEDWKSVSGGSKAPGVRVTHSRLVEARRLPPAERMRLLESTSGTAGSAMESVLLRVWAAENPAEATAWIATKSSGETNDNLRRVFDQWTNVDFEGARSWCERLPDSPNRIALCNRLATALALKGESDAAMKLVTIAGGDDAAEALTAITMTRVRRDPADTAKWLAELPANRGAGEIQLAVSAWFGRNAQEAAQWVESLPPGAARDSGIEGLNQSIRYADPSVAAEWITQVENSRTRTNLILWTLRDMQRAGPAAAQTWLRELPNVDPTWREFQLILNR